MNVRKKAILYIALVYAAIMVSFFNDNLICTIITVLIMLTTAMAVYFDKEYREKYIPYLSGNAMKVLIVFMFIASLITLYARYKLSI